MATLDTSPPDLELGRHHHRRRRSSSSSDDEEGSQFYSTIDNQSIAYLSDIEKDSVLESPRASSGVESDCAGMREKEEEERECRICQMSLSGENGEEEDGIELGCCCKDDLGAAHKSCAEAWFKIKGNKTCEICNSIAKNVFSSNETELTQHINDPITNAVPAQGPESRSCINGHRLVNFLLACMVFVFIISWLFHFNIHS